MIDYRSSVSSCDDVGGQLAPPVQPDAADGYHPSDVDSHDDDASSERGTVGGHLTVLTATKTKLDQVTGTPDSTKGRDDEAPGKRQNAEDSSDDPVQLTVLRFAC